MGVAGAGTPGGRLGDTGNQAGRLLGQEVGGVAEDFAIEEENEGRLIDMRNMKTGAPVNLVNI